MRQAELDLEFTELRAPVTGRIGDRRVSPGNLVTGGTGGNTTLLATIVSIDPIRFEFTFDEASFLRYERLATAGKRRGRAAASASRSRSKLIDEKDFAHPGRMDFVDNVIDRASGTIRGRARVRQRRTACSRPACSAACRCRARRPIEALLVPDAAIGTEQARKFVLVVDADNVARQQLRDAGPGRRRPARDQGRPRAPTTASSSTA